MAFQLSDDIIDLTGETGVSGKTPGTDLREGVQTLPVLLALRDDAPSRLRELLAGDLSDDAALTEALRLLRAHPAMDEARAILRRYADEARATLAPLPDTPAKGALWSLCDTVVARPA